MSEAEEERSEAQPASPAPPPRNEVADAPGAWVRIKRLLTGVVVLSLALATLYLLAERNSRTYYLSTEDGRLVVSKGAWLPAGKQPYLPEDAHAARVYAPVPIPEGVAPVPEQRFDERQDLDRVLFEILADWAEQRIRSDDPAAMRDGFELVERAGLFSGITAEQIARLRALRSELAYHEGRAQVEEALARLRQAREKLDLATEASSQRGQDATLLLQRIVPAMEGLQRALRLAPSLETEREPVRTESEDARPEVEEVEEPVVAEEVAPEAPRDREAEEVETPASDDAQPEQP